MVEQLLEYCSSLSLFNNRNRTISIIFVIMQIYKSFVAVCIDMNCIRVGKQKVINKE